MTPSRKRQRISKDSQAKSGARASSTLHTEGDRDKRLSKTLFVRSLPATTTTEELASFFSQGALLKHATAVLDKDTRQCKGFGFVTFAEPEDALKAKESLNGSSFAGKRIQIEVAEPRQRDTSKKVVSSDVEVGTKSQRKIEDGRNSAQDGQLPPRLIVRNLPWSITESEQLHRLFLSYGKIKDVKLPKTPDGRLRGFGFVLLRGRKNAESALTGLNGKEIDGRKLAVDWAAPKNVWEQQQAKSQSNTEVLTNTSGHSPQDASSYNLPSLTEETSEYDTCSFDGNLSSEASLESFSDTDDSISDSDGIGLGHEEDRSGTLFVRNLPFMVDDSHLYEHFRGFGPLRYARVVMDYTNEDESRSRGTGFVCFHRREDAQQCLREAPQPDSFKATGKDAVSVSHSLLEDARKDPTGRYTLEGRVLQISQCVERNQASKLEAESKAKRNKEDKRRLYLLREGTIASNSPLFKMMPDSEARMREASAKQRQDLVRKNPLLHISLTRLAIRNIPRFVISKDLKALARQAVVGFATDVKEGKRQPLNKEELRRVTPEMREAERQRKIKGKGIVKQAKIVFEGREGNKTDEKSAVSRSRGYGFIEYTSHRCALMGLRWLNGYLVNRSVEGVADGVQPTSDSAKRLIVEFAIENAQVVQRRRVREQNSRQQADSNLATTQEPGKPAHSSSRLKRRMETSEGTIEGPEGKAVGNVESKSLNRQQIIGRKRAKRKARRDKS